MQWPRTLALVVLFVGQSAAATAQAVPDAADPADAMRRWLALVASGSADEAWQQASQRFQVRIEPSDWGTWVRNNRRQIGEGAGSRRVLEFTVGQDEPPLPRVAWARGVFARDRGRGGRFLERVIVVREQGTWRVADFAAWADGQALVTSGSLDPVPFGYSYDGVFLGGFYRGRFRLASPPFL